jgi:hypothetical protein
MESLHLIRIQPQRHIELGVRGRSHPHPRPQDQDGGQVHLPQVEGQGQAKVPGVSEFIVYVEAGVTVFLCTTHNSRIKHNITWIDKSSLSWI